jgi:PAS domain S-box-containing protein
MERDLAKIPGKYIEVFEKANDAIFIHDFNGKMLEINEMACLQTGYSREELLELTLAKLDTPEFAAKIPERLKLLMRDGEAVFEAAHITKDGRVVPVEISSSIIDFGGEKAIMSIARNISDRKKSEQALRESEQKYKNLFHHSNDAIFIHDHNGNIMDINQRTLDLFGYSKEELISMKVPELHPPEELVKSKTAFESVSADGDVKFEIKFLKKNGEIFPAEVSANSMEIGGKKIIQGIVRDMSDRIREEELLRESEEKYRTLVEQSLQGVIIIQDFKLVFANSAMAQMSGYEIDELLWMKPDEVQNLIHIDDQEMVWSRMKDRFAGKDVPNNYELRIVRKNGEVWWLEIYATIIEFGGKPAIQATFIDIHERKAMEVTLQESEEQFRTLAEKSPNMIFINTKGHVVYANDRCEDLTGYTRDEFYSPDFNFFTLIDAGSRELVRENFRRHMANEDVAAYEYKLVTKEGRRIDAIINTKLINYKGERAILGIITDVTQTKLLEKQLRQSQKMEAIGTLAGGIAHDFNNLLIGIMGYSDLLLLKIKDDEKVRGEIKEIKKAAERAASLTKQLLAFGRRQMLQMEVLDLNQIVKEMEAMLRRLIGENIDFESILAPDLHTVKADPGQLELVIINLAINARDAMPDGGKLTISTENVKIDKEISSMMPDATDGDFVLLSVSDTGIGMDKATLARIFEPFFSTKGAGIGTGLGLSTVYGNVKQHNGWTKVSSEPGKGTTFIIFLPACALEPERREPEILSISDLHGRGEAILLVEDEERVRQFTARVLKENGYEVVEAGSAEEALEIFDRESGSFRLVFSDVVLPGKSGIQLVEELLSSNPGLKVVLNSGYTEQQSGWERISDKGYRFVQKPFSILDLLRAVATELRS